MAIREIIKGQVILGADILVEFQRFFPVNYLESIFFKIKRGVILATVKTYDAEYTLKRLSPKHYIVF